MPQKKRPASVYQYLKKANALLDAAQKAETLSERAKLEQRYRKQLSEAKTRMEEYGAQVDDRQLQQMAQAVNSKSKRGK